MNIVVDDLMTNYELLGAGRLVLLLHGWGDNSRGLAGLQRSLASAGYKVLSVDLPGFGGTQMPKQAWDLNDYATWTSDMLLKLQLGDPYAVIGHSNGGAVAVRALATGKITSDKLVLLAAAGLRSKKTVRRAAMSAVAKTGKAVTIVLPPSKRAALRKRLYARIGSDLLTAPHMEATFKKIVRDSVAEDAAQLDLPTLLIFGQNDKAVPPAHARAYNELIKNSQLAMVYAGHFVHLDAAQYTSDTISEFLNDRNN